jgi:hypothetical protein
VASQREQILPAFLDVADVKDTLGILPDDGTEPDLALDQGQAPEILASSPEQYEDNEAWFPTVEQQVRQPGTALGVQAHDLAADHSLPCPQSVQAFPFSAQSRSNNSLEIYPKVINSLAMSPAFTAWLRENAYLAVWISPAVALVGMLIRGSGKGGGEIDWARMMLYIGFLTCLAAVFTPAFGDEAWVFGGFVASGLAIYFMVQSHLDAMITRERKRREIELNLAKQVGAGSSN